MILFGELLFLLCGTVVCAIIMWFFRKGGAIKSVFGPDFLSPFMGTFSVCWLGLAFFQHHLLVLFVINVGICVLCVVLKKVVVEQLFQKAAVSTGDITGAVGRALLPALVASGIGVLTLPFFFSW